MCLCYSLCQSFDNYIIIGPPAITVSRHEYICEAGQSVTLECSVSADPEVNYVIWQTTDSNGSFVALNHDEEKYKGSSVKLPSLTIPKSHLADSGTYRCCATNDVGTCHSLPMSLKVSGSM